MERYEKSISLGQSDTFERHPDTDQLETERETLGRRTVVQAWIIGNVLWRWIERNGADTRATFQAFQCTKSNSIVKNATNKVNKQGV